MCRARLGGGVVSRRNRQPRQLRVDWPACRAEGLCHELLPELVDLDPWGYPVVAGEVTDDLLGHARAAVRACPRLALRLTAPPPSQRPRS